MGGAGKTAAMHEQDKAILEGLVSVAWADGAFQEREKEMLDALLESFGASEGEAEDMRSYAAKPRTLEDIPLTELSAEDRRLLLQHAVVLSWVDGEQAESEIKFLTDLRAHLNIPQDEGDALVNKSTERAKNLLKLLKEEDEAEAAAGN